MGGSATLDENILLDDLVGLADELRDELNADFGTRPYRVYTVLRSWESGAVGEGAYTETETELTPAPRVQPFEDSLSYELEDCGIDEAGFVKISEVSLTYTESELTGRPVSAAGVEGDMPEGQEWVIRIREAHGQAQHYRDFKIKGSPFPDREKDIGWRLNLIKVQETV